MPQITQGEKGGSSSSASKGNQQGHATFAPPSVEETEERKAPQTEQTNLHLPDIKRSLSSDNLIYKFLEIERATTKFDPIDVIDSNINLYRLAEEVIDKLKDDPRSSGEKVIEVDKIFKKMGYSYSPLPGQNVDHTQSLTMALKSKRIDCDMSAILILAIGEELGWKGLKLSTLPGHALLRVEGKNYDQGHSLPDEFYLKHFMQSPAAQEIPSPDAIMVLAEYNQAQFKIERKDWKGAIENLNRVISKYELANALFQRGHCKAALSNHASAILDYEKAIVVRPQYAPNYVNLANSYRETGNLKKALANSNKAIELDPTLPEAFLGRANVYYDNWQFIKGAADFRHAQKLEKERGQKKDEN